MLDDANLDEVIWVAIMLAGPTIIILTILLIALGRKSRFYHTRRK
jgi:hypothetical protein